MEIEEFENPTPRVIFPTPIILPSITWRKTATRLTVAPIDAIQVKAFRDNSVKIQCNDGQMFQIVQKYLKTNNAELYTFPKPKEKALKVVIRGLTTDISEDELSEELKTQGYEVTFIRQFIKAGRKLPMHMVSLIILPVQQRNLQHDFSIFYLRQSGALPLQ